MELFISSRSGFFKERDSQKLVDTNSMLRNHFEETLKNQIQNQDYGNGLKKIRIIFYIDLYHNWDPEYKYRSSLGEADVIIDAKKWLASSNKERLKLYAEAVKLAVNEFYNIMQTMKGKREFDMERFLQDVDIALTKASTESTRWYDANTDTCSTYEQVNSMK